MNKMLALLAGAALGLTLTVSANAATHEKVQAALDWTVPVLDCNQKPMLRGEGLVTIDAGGDAPEHDIDIYTLERHERKLKRWNKCVDDYKDGLNADFETLKSSAQYGLTKTQADTIMGNMKLIQSIIVSPDGVAPENK